jgi:hypothetical protein
MRKLKIRYKCKNCNKRVSLVQQQSYFVLADLNFSGETCCCGNNYNGLELVSFDLK